MRVKHIVITVLMLIPIFFGGVYTVNSLLSPKQEIIQGKTIPYKDFADMEKETQLVVIGKKIKTSENRITRDEDTKEYIDAYSIAEFKINKVLNNNTDNILMKNDIIKVMELSATDKDEFGVTHIFKYEDYEPMEDNKKYILYLDESRTEPGVYIIGAVNYGKIHLDTKEKIEHGKEKILNIHQKVKEKYKEDINKFIDSTQ